MSAVVPLAARSLGLPSCVALGLLAALLGCKAEIKDIEPGGGASGAEDAGGGGTGDDRGDGRDSGGAVDGGGDGAEPDGCEVYVSFLDPWDGDGAFLYVDPIEVGLNLPDATATVVLRAPSGEAVEGALTVSAGGRRLLLTPTAPLLPSTHYTLEVSVCDGAALARASFRTSASGGPVRADLVGRTYDLSFRRARFLAPALFGPLALETYRTDLLIGVLAIEGDQIQLVGAQAERAADPVQDHCRPSIAFPPADFTDPSFSLGPVTTTFTMPGLPITVQNMVLTGTFVEDGSRIVDGRMQGEVDVRTFGPEVDEILGFPFSGPDELCDFVGSFGAPCEPCASDRDRYCVRVDILRIRGSAIEAPIDCVAATDCHPLCATSSCADPSLGECL